MTSRRNPNRRHCRRPSRPCRTPPRAATRVDEEGGARPELLLSKNATGASLFGASVACGSNSIEQGVLHRILREGPLDCRPRDRLQLTLLKAEALARHGILAADRSAEIGRVVGTQRELHTGFVKPAQRVGLIGLEDVRGDV